MAEFQFEKIRGESKGYLALIILCAVVSVWGLIGFWVMWSQGHHTTGMTNQVMWGLPIINVVYLIGASAGSLIISALAGVFGKEEYKVFSRMASLLAALMIVGALLDIFLDIGRPITHGMNVMLHYNTTSVFTWNTILYSVYFVICVVYLLAQMEHKEKLVKGMAFFAVGWAVLVHTGTGMIIGFIYSIPMWHSDLTPPMFIISAIASGIGLFIPTMAVTFKAIKKPLPEHLLRGLAKIMGAMIVLLLYIFIVEFLVKGYVPAHVEALEMLLFNWELPMATAFWIFQILIGMIIPLAMLIYPRTYNSLTGLSVAGLLHAFGVWFERYILVIPGLSFPKELAPPGNVMQHTPPFEHGVYYVPGWPEVALTVGTFAMIFLAFLIGLKLFEIVPKTELIESEEVSEE